MTRLRRRGPTRLFMRRRVTIPLFDGKRSREGGPVRFRVGRRRVPRPRRVITVLVPVRRPGRGRRLPYHPFRRPGPRTVTGGGRLCSPRCFLKKGRGRGEVVGRRRRRGQITRRGQLTTWVRFRLVRCRRPHLRSSHRPVSRRSRDGLTTRRLRVIRRRTVVRVSRGRRPCDR